MTPTVINLDYRRSGPDRGSGGALDDGADAAIAFVRLQAHGKAPQPAQMRDDLVRGLGQGPPAVAMMAQRQRAVAVAGVAQNLDIGDVAFLRVLLRQQLAHAAVAALVM